MADEGTFLTASMKGFERKNCLFAQFEEEIFSILSMLRNELVV
jgi:hypothetical protein